MRRSRSLLSRFSFAIVVFFLPFEAMRVRSFVDLERVVDAQAGGGGSGCCGDAVAWPERMPRLALDLRRVAVSSSCRAVVESDGRARRMRPSLLVVSVDL